MLLPQPLCCCCRIISCRHRATCCRRCHRATRYDKLLPLRDADVVVAIAQRVEVIAIARRVVVVATTQRDMISRRHRATQLLSCCHRATQLLSCCHRTTQIHEGLEDNIFCCLSHFVVIVASRDADMKQKKGS